jgi:NADH-quinone oxidoreductase subunit J
MRQAIEELLKSADPVFALAATAALGSGILSVTRRNPVYAAVWLLFSFLSLAVIYLHLAAPFLAAMHVLVYTGAVLVLFLFVIMLLHLKDDELGKEYPIAVRGGVAVLCVALFGLLSLPVFLDPALRAAPPAATPAGFGEVKTVGTALFTTYALPFELASALILAAVFGAVLLAKRKAE